MMTYNELQYHLNFRQKDLHEAAKQYQLAKMAEQGRNKTNTVAAFLSPFIKLSLLVFFVYQFSLLVYS
jgi:hypothetical protein